VYDQLENIPDLYFKTISTTFKGQEHVYHVLLDQYCVNTICPMEKIVVQVAGWSAIGGSFFREFLTTFDFINLKMKLTPYGERNHIHKNAIQRVGIQISLYDASEIIFVDEDTPAWNKGIQEGDQILAINDIPIDELGFFGFYRLLEDETLNEYLFVIKKSEGQILSIPVHCS